MVGVRGGALQLRQQRLEANPQLQGRLAGPIRIEVGTGPQQQGLAGVDPLAPAQHRCHPFLRSQVFLALPAP